MNKPSLDAIMGNFDLIEPASTESTKDRKPVTFWVPGAYKDRYDNLQQISGRKFGKKAKEVFLAVIDLADARTG